jgi:hypothetical protein
MKNIILNSICLFLFPLFYNVVHAQTSILGNTSTNPAHFSGWNLGVNFDLNVRHFGNQHINLGTNGIDRMRIASYGNVGVGTGAVLIRPKFMSNLTNANASATPFASIAILGQNSFSPMQTAQITHIGVQGICNGISSGEEI